MSERPVVDQLALERTVLANERTLLSYLRTSLGFAAGGAMAIRVEPSGLPEQMLGALGIAFGALLAVVGAWRYLAARARFAALMSR